MAARIPRNANQQELDLLSESAEHAARSLKKSVEMMKNLGVASVTVDGIPTCIKAIKQIENLASAILSKATRIRQEELDKVIADRLAKIDEAMKSTGAEVPQNRASKTPERPSRKRTSS